MDIVMALLKMQNKPSLKQIWAQQIEFFIGSLKQKQILKFIVSLSGFQFFSKSFFDVSFLETIQLLSSFYSF